MIFVLIEHGMNGTVPMSTRAIGIEAQSFADAVEKLKTFPNIQKATRWHASEEGVTFFIPPEPSSSYSFPCAGAMHKHPLTIY